MVLGNSSHKLKLVIYFLVALLVIGSVYLVLVPKSVQVETYTLSKKHFIETLSTEGKIQSKNKKIIYSIATGSLHDINLKVGHAVKKGQTLATLQWDRLQKVISPIDGVVSRVYREADGPIQRGEAIAEIINVDDLEIVAEPLTTDAVKLKKGFSVQVEGWGGAHPIEAVVTDISRAGFVKLSALGVEEERTLVRMDMKDVPQEILNRLGGEYHVDLVFKISERQEALTIPLGALFRLESGAWACYQIIGKKTELKTVEISSRNDREAVVSAGLKEGDQVILYPSDRVKPGIKVKKEK